MPDDLDPFDETVNVDFTRLTPRAVGAVHSRFCNRLAHALYVRSEIETRRLVASRQLHIAQARYRVSREDDFKTVKMLEAHMNLSPEIKKLTKKALGLDVKAVALDAVIKGYESIIKAASRDMSRRGIEAANVSRD